VQGTEGELESDEAAGRITIRRFALSEPEVVSVPRSTEYHPEDKAIVADWLAAVRDPAAPSVAVTAREALRTHAIVFAAEQSRRERRVIEMSEFRCPDSP
jgi:predicted dehydrogenase